MQLVQHAQWRVICPACSHVELSHESAGNCPNCRGGIALYTPTLIPGYAWDSEDTRLSWHRICCIRGCGWFVNQFECSKCGAKICGAFLQSLQPPSACFVSSVCFGVSDRRTELLRLFRDDVLSRSRIGRLFIRGYWSLGPRLARACGRWRFVKWLCQLLILGAVGLLSVRSRYLIRHGHIAVVGSSDAVSIW